MNNPNYRIYPQPDTEDDTADNLAACLETQTFRIYSRIPKEVDMNATSTNTTPRSYVDTEEAEVSAFKKPGLSEAPEPVVASTTVLPRSPLEETDTTNATILKEPELPSTFAAETGFKKPDVSESVMPTARFYMDESAERESPAFKQPVATSPEPVSETVAQSGADLSQMKPGARLRYTREQKNLSVQYVADSLYLGTHIINAIENDDYDSLPSAVFIRGYLRNYAKLLEVPGEAVIEAYDLMGQKPPPTLAPQISPKNNKSQAKSGDFWVKVITSVLVIGVMISMTLWSIYSSTPPSRHADPVGDADGRTLVLPDQGPNAADGNVYTPPAEDDSESGKNSPLVTLDPKHPGNAAVGVTPTAAPDNKLIVHVKQRTWLEVTDSTGKSLYKDSLDKDLDITGTPPFKVKVSKNSHIERVSIEHKGEKSELKSMTPVREGKFSIFTIGSATAQPPQ